MVIQGLTVQNVPILMVHTHTFSPSLPLSLSRPKNRKSRNLAIKSEWRKTKKTNKKKKERAKKKKITNRIDNSTFLPPLLHCPSTSLQSHSGFLSPFPTLSVSPFLASILFVHKQTQHQSQVTCTTLPIAYTLHQVNVYKYLI